MENTKLRLRKM